MTENTAAIESILEIAVNLATDGHNLTGSELVQDQDGPSHSPFTIKH